MILKQAEAAEFATRFAQIAENVDQAILGKGHRRHRITITRVSAIGIGGILQGRDL